MTCRTYDSDGKLLTICHELATVTADRDHLRALLVRICEAHEEGGDLALVIDEAGRQMGHLVTGTGERPLDLVPCPDGSRVLCVDPSGGERRVTRPSAYLWFLTVERDRMKRLSLNKVNPWGRRGVDFSPDAKVECIPLYRSAQPQNEEQT